MPDIDPTQLGGDTSASDMGGLAPLQLQPDQIKSLQSDIGTTQGKEDALDQQQADSANQSFDQQAPTRGNILDRLPPLLLISAFAGKASKLDAGAMLASTTGMVKGYLDGKEDVYQENQAKYKAAYDAYKARQEQQQKIYDKMREAYKGRIDGDIKALQFARQVTGDEVKYQQNQIMMHTQLQNAQTNLDKLHETERHDKAVEEIHDRKQDVVEKKAAEAANNPEADAVLAAAADKGVSLFPAGMRSKDLQNRTLAAIVKAHPDMTPEQIVDGIRSGQIDMKTTMGEAQVAAKKEGAIASAVNALNLQGGLYDQLDAAAKKIDFGDSKTVNQLRLAAQGHAVANPDIQAYQTTLNEAKAEVVQVLSRTGQPTDVVRGEADAMFPQAASYKELQAAIAASKKVAVAVAQGNEQVISALKAGTPIIQIANGLAKQPAAAQGAGGSQQQSTSKSGRPMVQINGQWFYADSSPSQ